MEFLSDEQAAASGRFAGAPSREQRELYFVPDDTDCGLGGRLWRALGAQAGTEGTRRTGTDA